MEEWVTRAAKEIVAIDSDCHCSVIDVEQVVAIVSAHIAKHVPRCETCKYWASHTGACTAISIDAPKMPRGSLLLITTADFGCVRWKGKQ